MVVASLVGRAQGGEGEELPRAQGVEGEEEEEGSLLGTRMVAELNIRSAFVAPPVRSGVERARGGGGGARSGALWGQGCREGEGVALQVHGGEGGAFHRWRAGDVAWMQAQALHSAC
jgi:hypothetical protein